MMNTQTSPPQHDSPWPHRFAVLLTCATFPLIWVGGLVTTYDAGMAVPDWPSTYGYNLFLYPWQTWIAGPWDLFIEHGHRLLGALTGMIAIALVVAMYRGESRLWLRRLSLSALALVIFQGFLGGARVLMDERLLAMVHGCVGPLFFALSVSLCVFSSRLWKDASGPTRSATLAHRLAVATPLAAYLQLILGAVLRHMPAAASHQTFRIAVVFHLVMALAVTVHVFALLWRILCDYRQHAALRFPAGLLGVLVLFQLLLGGATWVAKYSWPTWMADWAPANYTIQASGLLQSLTITAHVATGSLILSVSVWTGLRLLRLAPANLPARRSSVSVLGGAAI